MNGFFSCGIAIILLIFAICGCSNIPIKDGELVLSDKTSATLDEPGVGRVINRF